MEIKTENIVSAATVAQVVDVFRAARAAADAGGIVTAVKLGEAAAELAGLLPAENAGAARTFGKVIADYLAIWRK